MTYPDGIDALVNVNANQSLAAGGHAARHNSTNTALEEVRNFLASGSANTVLTAGSPVPLWAPSAAGGGKILQIVRATDTTDRSTTSASFVDVTGMSITITPQKSDSAVILICSVLIAMGNNGASILTLTDSSNNPISGAEAGTTQDTSSANQINTLILIGYATPATTSAVTYKLRALLSAGSVVEIRNSNQTGQLYAVEVSA
jgi:hypothetical protein